MKDNKLGSKLLATIAGLAAMAMANASIPTITPEIIATTKDDSPPIVLTPTSAQKLMSAAHYSHSSHVSHASHASHYSHYSSRY